MTSYSVTFPRDTICGDTPSTWICFPGTLYVALHQVPGYKICGTLCAVIHQVPGYKFNGKLCADLQQVHENKLKGTKNDKIQQYKR